LVGFIARSDQQHSSGKRKPLLRGIKGPDVLAQ
jgi:hypothetical protein